MLRFYLGALGAMTLLTSLPTLAMPQAENDSPELSQVTISSERRVLIGAERGLPVELVQLRRRVSYSDLDLASEGGAAKLRERIQNTAREACRQLDQLYPVNTGDQLSVDRQCVDQAVDSAMPTATAAIGTAKESVYAAEIRVNQAVIALGKLKKDPGFSRTLQHAEGVVIVPNASQNGPAASDADNNGAVLLVRRHGTWSNPAFYKIAVAGESAPQIRRGEALALLLMNRRAVAAIETHTSAWDLQHQRGLTVLSHSAITPKSTGKADIVEWTQDLGSNRVAMNQISKVRWDESANRAYYGKSQLTSQQILDADAVNPHKGNANLLKGVLPLRVAAR